MRQVSYSTRDTHKGSRLATALCIVGFQKIAKLINRKQKKKDLQQQMQKLLLNISKLRKNTTRLLIT